MTSHTDALVVGAGPTGLAMALTLAQSGVPTRIIDKNTSRSDKSRAIGVHAGTLELLRASFGNKIVQRMLESGLPARKFFFHRHREKPISVDLGQIPSIYNFILILEQSETEKILEEELNQYSVRVERQTEFVSFEEKSDSVVSLLRRPDQKVEELASNFIVGADGAHSRVREQLQIPF